ncbi:MAG: cellulase family glycosylhydrolase [Candidatus Dormibacteraeota bacterium]|nr:cellulase family glycosylhydrolase [Candidatus Dormibacteraeota bacterium]
MPASRSWTRPATYVRPRRLLLGLAMIAVTAVALGDVRLASASGAFVRAVGTQFYIGGTPFRFVGYDAYQTTSTSPGYQCGGVYTDAEMDQFYSEMQSASGASVARVWFFQSYQAGNPANFAQYDRVLSFAAAHGIRVVATLENQWTACEPNHAYRDITWYQGGYRSPDSGYPLSYRDFVHAMAAHYVGDPRIAMWQLVNEGEAKDASGNCNEAAAAQAMHAFAEDMAGVIKSVDTNHLVSLGTMGGGQCGAVGSDYATLHSGGIDVCEFHDYNNDAVAMVANLSLRLAQCKALNKPLFMGEAGIQSTSGQARADEFSAKLTAFFGGGGGGYLIWSKHITGDGGYSVGPGDPVEGVMLSWAQRLGSAQAPVPGGLIVTDGDPAPNSSNTPGAHVAGARVSAGGRNSTAAAGSPPAILEVVPLSEWLLHRIR